MNLYKFWVGLRSGLSGLAKKRGNLIATEDTGELFIDTGDSTRKQIGYSRDDIDFRLSGYISAERVSAVIDDSTPDTALVTAGAVRAYVKKLLQAEPEPEIVTEVLNTVPYDPDKPYHIRIDGVTETIDNDDLIFTII